MPDFQRNITTKMARLEKTTDLIVFNMLRVKGFVDGNFDDLREGVKTWAKKSSHTEINEILKKASKKQTGKIGFPEYIILDEKNNIVLIIENKKSVTKHLYPEIDKNVDTYAVNGALWYAKFLKESFDVIAIAISGNSIGNLKIDTYAWRKMYETFTNLNIHELLEIAKYRDILLQSKKSQVNKNSLSKLTEKANEINVFLRDYIGVIEHERLYLLGSILFALEDPIFKMAYAQINNDNDLSEFVFQTVERKIKGSQLDQKDIVINELKSVLIGLKDSGKEKVKEIFPNGAILELVKRVDNILFDLYKNSELDMMSTFFNVFLSYSTSGGSDLGIVLTPSHITSLFSDLAGVNLKSKVLDICAGTGGFLTSAWKRISLDPGISYSDKEKFRKNNIFGVEKEKSIYTIIALNMFINKDGRSNLFYGDAFNLKNNLRKFNCNVGFLNPPFSDTVYAEISFVELLLDSLLPGSTGVVILPVNSVSSRTKKHSGLVEIKERLLNKNKLVASIQMPGQLFYPKGTETVILVFETGVQNSGDTWFAKLDDGYTLIKHQKTRTPTENAPIRYKEFMNAYYDKSDSSFSFSKAVTPGEQWVYTVHSDTEYTLSTQDFQNTVNEYISYLFLNNYL